MNLAVTPPDNKPADQPAEPLPAFAMELVSLRDLEKIPELMAGFALSLKAGEEFKVKI